jgi:hypothetical protein
MVKLLLMVNCSLTRSSTTNCCNLPERFWVDLVLRNPLDTEVNLSDLKIVVEEAHTANAEPSEGFIEVESINDVVLGPRETQTV